MRIIRARNVHHALPEAMGLLHSLGIKRDSRNGPVMVAPWPVVTEYHSPSEKLTWWPQRDVNVAFLIYEAFWMLSGRNDIAPLTRYIKGFGRYSDDGKTQHGAYGHRWRTRFGFDQLEVIIERLRANPEDRRSILAMWDAKLDLNPTDASKDVPCNTTASFQRDVEGRLDLNVFCRSNDIIWGAYFANAFHFATLLEYMAAHIGCEVGVYRQISINYHAYQDVFDTTWSAMVDTMCPDRYAEGSAIACSLTDVPADDIELQISYVLLAADSDFKNDQALTLHPVMQAAYNVLIAHHLYRTLDAPERFELAMESLTHNAYDGSKTPESVSQFMKLDWIAMMRAWLMNRKLVWEQTTVHRENRK